MSTGCQKTIFPYVNMSVCQYVRIQLFSLGIKMKVVQNVIRMSDNQYVICHYVNTSICQDLTMSGCQYVRMQLFSLGIKMKVVQNVIRMSDRHYVIMSICQNETFQLRYQNESCS